MEDNINVKKIVLDSLEDIGILIKADSDEDINLTEFAIDSLSFISFIVELEDKLAIDIPDSFLLVEVLQSLNGFIGLIEQIVCENNNTVSL